MRQKCISVAVAAILASPFVSGPAAAGTDSPWVFAAKKSAKGRFLADGDRVKVCDLRKKDGYAAGIFVFGRWSDADEFGGVVTDRPGSCVTAAYNYVLMEGVEIRIKVCRVRQKPFKITGCSKFVNARA